MAVIGGGIAGLAAAWHLRQKGIPVQVFDAGERPGGVIRSARSGGFLAEEGPHSLARPSARVRALFRDAGLEDEILSADPEESARFIVRDGHPVALPSSPLGLLLTPLLSARSRLRVVTEPLRRRTRPPDEDESVAGVIRRRGLGDEVVERFLNPFVAGVYAGDPEHLSAPHAFPMLREIEMEHGSLVRGVLSKIRQARRDRRIEERAASEAGGDAGAAGVEGDPVGHQAIVSFRDGMETLPRALAQGLGPDAYHPETPVLGVRRAGSGEETGAGAPASPREPRWILETARGPEGPFAAVVAALPAPALARLDWSRSGPEGGSAELSSTALEPLRHVRYPPLALLTLGFQRSQVEHPLNGFGMLIPAVEGREVLGALFPSTLFRGRAPEGHVLISTFVGGTRQPNLALEDPDQIEARVRRELESLLGVRGTPRFRHLALWPDSIPQINVGYGAVRDAGRDLEERLPGIVLAGNWVGGVSVGAVLESGLDAAERIKNILN